MVIGLAKLFRVMVASGLVAVGLLLGTGAAQAGGPTSAVLVSPGNAQAAAVYYSSPEYQELLTFLGGTDPVPDSAAPDASGSANQLSGNYVTVTWLIHDVSIWRIDRVFLPRTGDPWIVTEVSDGGPISADGMYPGQSGDDNAIKHRSPYPEKLTALLAGLGLLGPSTPVIADFVAPAADQQQVASPVPASAVDSMARAVAPWWWALAGLAVGGLLTATLIRFVPGIRERVLERPADDTRRMIEQPN